MEPKTFSPQTPPPNYQQTMQINNDQTGPNPQQHHQFQHHHQQANIYPVHPPIVNEQGKF